MDAWRYGIYLLVFTFDISLVRCAHGSFDIDVINSISPISIEDKFHISARPCIILYLSHLFDQPTPGARVETKCETQREKNYPSPYTRVG